MPDDDSAPLGLVRPAASRRALPIWPFLAGPTLLILTALIAWAALRSGPHSDPPQVTVKLQAPVAVAPPAVPADPNGQISIRDP